jgi:branched-subunit amino acid transport protein
MGLMAFAMRALPQLFFVGQEFSETWDRLLRYLSYAFICSIVSITLFMSGARFDVAAAPYRGLALAVTIFIALKPRDRSWVCSSARYWFWWRHGCAEIG